MPYYTIKYKLVIRLGPINSPNQNTTLPKVSLPLMNLVLLNAASGSCVNWNVNRYPLTFLNRQNIRTSCTTALSKNVKKVACILERWKKDMDEW